MTFQELQNEISKYVYTEDNGMARIALASIITTRMKLGDPVWMIIIGASSGGKSQILRPLALTDEKFIHRIDDMTENTLLSGVKVKQGQKEMSLLKRIGAMGIIVISDFTVIFSKSSETKASILGQLRMVYDGEMTKYSGNSSDAITWKGSLGVLAGSTPSIYAHFEQVADMGERFIYYRMKPYDIEKATRISLGRKLFGKQLDHTLSELYANYLKEAIQNVKCDIPDISDQVNERIISISMMASKLRTPTNYDKYSRTITKIPVSEMPMRVALQLRAIAKGLMIMQYYDSGSWDLTEEDILNIEWCAYSLANEEIRTCLNILAQTTQYDDTVKTSDISDEIGLDIGVTEMNLQHLHAIGVIDRSKDSSSGEAYWRIKDSRMWEIIKRFSKKKFECEEKDVF